MNEMIKKSFKILVIIAIAFYFLPMFTVSCSGLGINENVSAFHTTIGYEMDGDTLSSPMPFLIILLLLPAGILAILLIKKVKTMASYIVCTVFAVIQLIGYAGFKVGVEEFCEENMCQFKVLGWYYINVILILAIIVMAVYLAVKGADTEGKTAAAFAPAISSSEGWTCPNCGIRYSLESRFCGSCGMSYEDAVAAVPPVQEAEEASAGFCPQCGAELGNGAIFCRSCGYKIIE